LFVGTPCRAAAVKSFIGESDLLFTADIICHGVPTSKLYEKYLSEYHRGRAVSVSFRDKSLGWQEYSMRVDTDEKTYRSSRYKDSYLRLFSSSAPLRGSCYDCRFKGSAYASDMTIGDYWGISSCIPSMNDDRGTSVVIIRTDRGEKMFDGISDALVYKKSTLEDAERTNVSLNVSAKMPASRDKLIEMIERDEAYETIASNFGRPASAKVIISERVKRRVKKVLGKIKR
ncbi:MAG: Coenzyme F420 hydrogenase/dehydrogenase, beta subunit C-terminal domain, partial [Clostridia bacterium]|nr:Coenzyme F420 hydrogenase/dehydrogenase, beta subunit C-terminal domain [Clostridia bacterium]